MKVLKLVLILLLGLPFFKLSGATYYFGSNAGTVSTLGSWFTTSGASSGTSPGNFTTAGDVFIINASSGTATWNVNANWILTGTLEIQSGTVDLTKTITNGGTRSISLGGLIVASGATVTFGGANGDATINGNITNNGTINYSGTNPGPTFGSTISIVNSGTISTTITLTILAGNTLTNNGTITTTAATPFTDSRASRSYGGTVTLASLNGGQTISGGFTFNNLTLSNTTLTNTLAASAAVTVNGTLTITNANMYLNLNGGTLTVNAFAGSGALTGSTASSVVYTGGTNSTMLMNTTTPGTTNALGNLTLNSNTNLTLGTALSISTALTTTAGGTLAMGANTLTLSAAGTTLTNGGTISTTATPTWISDSRSPGAGTYSGTITFAGTSAQTIQTGTYTNLTVSGAGVKTIASAVTVSKILTTTVSGGAVSIISSGSLTLSGTLSGAERHVIGGPIECNGGDFIVTGNKDQGTGVPPFMFISSSITDISSAGAGRVGCIQFKPSNTGSLTSKRSVIRFVGSSLSLGNTTGAGDRSIVTNDRVYFEVGDGSTTTSLTLNDTLCIFNGIRLRSSSTLSSNGKLKLGSSATNKFGGSSFNGYMDTVDATGTLPVFNGNISLIMTMEGSRKFRFLGNPFSGSLNITDFTDDIDITGTIGTNTNNFTSTNTNSPSAFIYTTSSNSWTALTSSSPTSLSSLEGLRVLVRGAKGEGLTVGSGSYTPSVARIAISGAPIIGNKTISNLSFNSSNSNGYNLVTNPLLAPVDLSLLYNAVGGGSGSGLNNVSSTVTVYTPSLSGMKTYDLSNGNWSGGGSNKGDVWLPGSSIIFQVTSATNSILVEDLDKLSPLGRTYTSMFAELDSVKNIGQFLISRDNGRLSLTDGVSLDFGNRKEANDSYNFGIDAEDFGTDSVNLSLISPEGKYLAISKTNSLNVNDIRRYPMSVSIRNSSLNGNYKIAFELFKAFEPGYQIILLDKYLNISTDLFMNPSYDFKISDDLNSKGDNRFEIVVSKSQLGIDDIVNSKVVDFFINQDLSQNVLSFSFTGTSSNHELLIFDVQGKQVYFRDCQKDSVVLPSDKFKPGVYFASVRSGEVTKTKKFVLIY